MDVTAAGWSGRSIVAGRGRGPLCRLRGPISFWGGVDPATGTVVDPRHPDAGRELAGTVLVLPRTIGSSSSSAIFLELLRGGCAPAALILGEIDAILVLGVLVAEELGYPTVPVVQLPAADLEALPQGALVEVVDGLVREQGAPPASGEAGQRRV